MLQTISAGLTDKGKKRSQNEDAFIINEDLHLYIVADGMGGHQAGDVASKLVTEGIQGDAQDYIVNGKDLSPNEMDETLSLEGNILLTSIFATNESIHSKAKKDEQLRSMGSTMAAVLLTDFSILAANVGDSPIYLIRHGEIEQLSVTHTVYAEQFALDPLQADRLEPHYHHVLTRAMGIRGEVVPDIVELPYHQEDCLVICSDGLSNLVNKQEIRRIAEKNSPEKGCQELVSMALERGGTDNITVIIVKIEKENTKTSSFFEFCKTCWENILSRFQKTAS